MCQAHRCAAAGERGDPTPWLAFLSGLGKQRVGSEHGFAGSVLWAPTPASATSKLCHLGQIPNL